MLIRIITEELIEYPDELGALVLAESTTPDAPPIPLDEVNLVVNGVLGLIYKENFSLEENIKRARAHCTLCGTPDDVAMEKALAQIKEYNEKVPTEEIGYSSQDLIEYYYLDPKPKIKPYTIDQDLQEIGKTPILAGPTSTQPPNNE